MVVRVAVGPEVLNRFSSDGRTTGVPPTIDD
jgi:hypothetical protein